MNQKIIANYLKSKARIPPVSQRLPKLNLECVVSVVVPAYNEANFVKRLLMALEMQTLDRARYEVLVVDNGSSDGTVDGIKMFRSGVTYPLHLMVEKLPGAGNARKTGIDEVVRRYFERRDGNRHYIAITDADIVPDPRWLSTIVDTLKSKPKSAAISGTYHADYKTDTHIEKKIGLENYFQKFSTICDYLDKLVGQTRLRGPNSGFEVECYVAAGGFEQPIGKDGSIAPRECFQLGERMMAQGYRIYPLNLSIVASQRRKLYDLLNKSTSYQKIDSDKRFKSVRESEDEMLNLATSTIPLSDWLDYQKLTLGIIVKNVLFAPVYSDLKKIKNLRDLLGDTLLVKLGKDIKDMELEGLAAKWSSVVLAAIEDKLESRK